MRKTVIVLPDGREISSGVSEDNVITSVKLTQCVNDTRELSPGSTCANMLEGKLLIPAGGLQISAGAELTVYMEDNGVRQLMGVYIAEKPTRATANTFSLTAYDRVIKLDKDLTQWLAGLEGWPYSLRTFAGMVCSACGLTLENDEIPNGDYEIQAFSAWGITGRKLIQWVGQIAGRFCRATPKGTLEFAWYTPSGVTLTPGGPRFYYQNGLSYENYQVAPIEKVWLRLTQEDVGTVWPDEAGEKNTYCITGNFLLTTVSTDALIPVARTLYENLKDIRYTPCKVSIPACMDLQAGHTLQITDAAGKTITAYVMTKTQSAQGDTLECTGSPHRGSSTAMNSEDYRVHNSKLLELQKLANGLTLRALETETDVANIKKSVTDVQAKADTLNIRVAETESRTRQAMESVSGTVETLQKEVSTKMTAEAVELKIQSAMEQGTSKVVTSTGFTFDDEGMTIEKSGSEMKTQITENGMVVYQNSDEVLTANNKGVDAKDLHATTYLIVGSHSRFEDYGLDRTGCFWIGG